MNKHARKFLALILALMLLVPAAAAFAGSSDSEPEFAPSDIRYKYYGSMGGDKLYTPDNTWMMKFYKEKFNVDSVTILGTRSASIQEELLIDQVSGEKIDIFALSAHPLEFPLKNYITKMALENVFMDLEPLLPDYHNLYEGTYSELTPAMVKGVINNPVFNGSMYFMPCNYYEGGNYSLNGWQFTIRGDIADDLGIEEGFRAGIRTIDDLYNLLTTIQSKDYKDVNGNYTYPIGLIGPWPHTIAAMCRPFDFGGGIGGNEVDFDQNGELNHFIFTDYAWDQIQWVRKLIADDLLDPESFTQPYNVGEEKISQGKYGVTAMWYGMPQEWNNMTRTLMSVEPGWQYRAMGNMENYKGEDVITINLGLSYATFVALAQNTQYKDVLLAMLDWANSREGRAYTDLGLRVGDVDGAPVSWFWNDDNYAEIEMDFYRKYSNWTETEEGSGVDAEGLTYDEFMERADKFYNRNDLMMDPPITFSGYGMLFGYALNHIGGKGHNNPYGGRGDNSGYQMWIKYDSLGYERSLVQDKYNLNSTREFVAVNGVNLSFMLNEYPNKERIEPVLNTESDTMIQAYLANSDAEALSILQGFRDTLNNNGMQEYLAYLKECYDANPDYFITYSSMVQ